ncbi:MAG: hypothetical protein SCK28_03155 [Bacillota bacterium]|nr:hypothetical protein [Bacillota bacterium]
MKRNKLILLVVFLIFIVSAKVYLDNKNSDSVKVAAGEDNGTAKPSIELSFTPLPITKLDPITIESEWELIESKTVHNISGVEQILVSIFKVNEWENILILQDKHGFYDLAMSFEGGLERVTVKAVDMTDNGAEELFISTVQGATVTDSKIFSYDGEAWLCLLASENLINVDLDGDGKTELAATSMGSVPGFVSIYRYNDTTFESSDLVAATDSVHVAIITDNNRKLIETFDGEATYYYQVEFLAEGIFLVPIDL